MSLTDGDFVHLQNAINICYDDFVAKLINAYPNLTAKDVYLCCLIKMNLTNQDMELLLDMKSSNLKKRKYRLKTDKFDCPESETLEDFVHAFNPPQ